MYEEKVEVKRKIDEANDGIGKGKGYQRSNTSFSRFSSITSFIKHSTVADSYRAVMLNIKSELSWQTLKDKQTGPNPMRASTLVCLNATIITNRSNISRPGCLPAPEKLTAVTTHYLQTTD